MTQNDDATQWQGGDDAGCETDAGSCSKYSADNPDQKSCADASYAVPSTRLDHALKYAAEGTPVFPIWWWDPNRNNGAGGCACGDPDCTSPAKHPLYNRDEGLINGLYAATQDEDRIRHWWTRWPDANIGAPTGAVSGYDVLDIDVQNDGVAAWTRLVEANEPLPATTTTTQTPKGGWHFRFAHADGQTNARGNLPPGIDVRGDGGYVLLPPGATREGEYSWLRAPAGGPEEPWPAWLLRIVQPDQAEPGERSRNTRRGGRHRPEPIPDRILEGGRNPTLTRIAGRSRRDGDSEEAIFARISALNLERCEPPLEEREVRRIAHSVARYEPAEDIQRSEYYNAREVVHRHGRDLRYCPPWRKWIVWDGRRWLVDRTGEAMRRVKRTVLTLGAEWEAIEDAPLRNRMLDWARSSENAGRLQATLRLAESEPSIAILPEQLDTNPYLINTLNGTVDLRTGELRPHSRDDLITKIVNAAYVPDATCPTFDQTLAYAMCNDPDLLNYVQKALGYALLGQVQEKALFIAYGATNTAKTTIYVDGVQRTLGDYAIAPSEATIAMRDVDAIPNDVAELQGVRFAIVSEPRAGLRLNEARLKAMTGRNRLRGRRLYENEFEFEASHTFFIDTNHLPVINDSDDAIWGRVKVIPHRHRVKCIDPTIPDRLNEERDGILAWLVAGCLRWQAEGLADEPAAVRDMVRGYRDDSDPLGRWMDERTEEAPGQWVATGDLYWDYRTWCEQNGEEPMDNRQFGITLGRKGIRAVQHSSTRQRGREGLALRPAEELRPAGQRRLVLDQHATDDGR